MENKNLQTKILKKLPVYNYNYIDLIKTLFWILCPYLTVWICFVPGGILTLFLYGMQWQRFAFITASDLVSDAYADALSKAFQQYYDETNVYVVHHYADISHNISNTDLYDMFHSIIYEARSKFFR